MKARGYRLLRKPQNLTSERQLKSHESFTPQNFLRLWYVTIYVVLIKPYSFYFKNTLKGAHFAELIFNRSRCY